MLLHTHTVADDESGEDVEMYVLHTTQEETKTLHFALSNALVKSPESDSFLITLGKVEALKEPTEPIVTFHPTTEEPADE